MSSEKLLDRLRPGTSIYLPGATGESIALGKLLSVDVERLRGIAVTSCLLPGMNSFDFIGCSEDIQLTTFMLPPSLHPAFATGRVRLMPLAYSGIARHIAAMELDIAVVHLSPPDNDGWASCGIAADFAPIAWAAAKQRVAIVNPAMPAMPRGPSLPLAQADLIVEIEGPLVEISAARQDDVAHAIAGRVATLIPDHASLQIGIGAAPAALWAALADHRGLRLRSGMVGEELLMLADRGALAADGHVAGIAVGSQSFYGRLAERDLVRFGDTRETHDSAGIAREARFFAVNSALEVDLFGQINLEWQGGRPVSGVGGAPDFAAAGLASAGGRSIMMLPATARGGTISRIVSCLSGATVSLPRNLADMIVTEHGVADLRGASLDDRADALIAIADPLWRDALSDQWRTLRMVWR
jgi:acyl-CoA hydrolase